jgi:hypothetical protein
MPCLWPEKQGLSEAVDMETDTDQLGDAANPPHQPKPIQNASPIYPKAFNLTADHSGACK